MLQEHFGYVSDAVRLQLFRRAVGEVIRPGNRVVDIGCGSGVLGLMCLRAGAAHIYGIDETAMLEVARESFERAGLADQSTFFRANSRRTRLPDLVDVAICDHVGFFGFDYGIIPLMTEARRRFLRPNGKLVPSALRLFAATTDSAECRRVVDAWRQAPVPTEFHWIGETVINRHHDVKLKSSDLNSEPRTLGDIDFYVDSPDFLSWSTNLTVTRDGQVDGLVGWFEAQLAPGLWMTNSPLSQYAINRPQAYLPIETPIPVKAGETVMATVMTRPSENMIAWVVEHYESGKRFRQSTWRGRTLTPEDLRKGDTNRMPQLKPSGAARLSVLQLCDGRRSAKEIEDAVLAEYPDLFPSASEIRAFVAEVLGRDAE